MACCCQFRYLRHERFISSEVDIDKEVRPKLPYLHLAQGAATTNKAMRTMRIA